MKKLIEITEDQLQVICDKPGCGYKVSYKKERDLINFLNKPCPDCGTNLLVKEDYIEFMQFMKTVKFLNKWFSWLRYIPFINKKSQTIHVNTHGGLHMVREEKNEGHRVSGTRDAGPR